MDKPIVNINEVKLVPRPAEFAAEGPAADHFALSSAQLGRKLGAKKLGYNISSVPPGGPETAHQIRNTGTAELRYLAVSTRVSPQICDYPDSGKFGVYAELAPGRDGKPGYFYFMGRQEQLLDYWAGEGGNPR